MKAYENNGRGVLFVCWTRRSRYAALKTVMRIGRDVVEIKFLISSLTRVLQHVCKLASSTGKFADENADVKIIFEVW